MPVIRRKALLLKPTVPPPTEITTSASPFLNEKELRQYLKCSKHEVRKLVKGKILTPVPYLHGIKPWRFLRSAVDQHIAQQVAQAVKAA
jgi:predicted DNA-binding transcriptional regulator AlpA